MEVKKERKEFLNKLNARDLLDKFHKEQDAKEEVTDELYVEEDVKEAMAKAEREER